MVGLGFFVAGRSDTEKAMSQIGIDRGALTALVQYEGLPKVFVSDILKSLTECDDGILVPYVFSNGNSAGRDPGSREECLVLISKGYENAAHVAITKPPSLTHPYTAARCQPRFEGESDEVRC